MTFNWTEKDGLDPNHLNSLIDIEYQLRRKLMKLIIQDESLECCANYSCFELDFCIKNHQLSVSQSTPEPYKTKLENLIDLIM